MSSPPVNPDIISSLLTAEYCSVAALSLVTYDWLIRFDDEIRCFWNIRHGRKLTAAALVYALSRYVLIVQVALAVQTIQTMSDTGCRITLYTQSVTSILSFLTPAVFSALRVYALSGRNRMLAGSTLLLLGVPFGINTAGFAFYHITNLPSPFNCSAEDGTPEGLRRRLVLASRICAIIGDLSVLVVTWWNTYALYRMQHGWLTRQSLTGVMLYNGSAYFIAISALNLFQMVFAILNQASTIPLVLYTADSYVDTFISPITSVLICHFLLNLRQADRAAAGPSGSSLSAVNSLHFEPQLQTASLPDFIFSMGEPVHTGLDTIEEATEEEVLRESVLGSLPGGEHGEGFDDEAQVDINANLDSQDICPYLGGNRTLA